MTTQTKQKKIPKLRFPGFIGEWERKKLGEVAEVVGGGTPDTQEKRFWNGDINWFTPTEIKQKYVYESKRKISRLGLTKSSTKLLPSGTLLLTSRATIGDIAIATRESTTNQGFQSLIIKKGFSNEFVYYWLIMNKKELLRRSNGSTFLEISGHEVKKIKLNFPSLPEQKKIASFLQTVDEYIQNLKKQKESLEEYKKGILQKVFSQEIRFKADDGTEFPDWEEKRLGEALIRVQREKNKPNKSYVSIGLRSHFKGTFQRVVKDPTKISMDKLYEVREEDFIVNITFAWEGALAIVKKEDEGGLVSHRFPTFTFRKEISNSNFFKYIYPSRRMKHYLTNISPGGAGRNRVLNLKDFLNLKINLPSLPEQQKIANFLTSIDNLIELKENQFNKAQEWKKGLLQQMFV